MYTHLYIYMPTCAISQTCSTHPSSCRYRRWHSQQTTLHASNSPPFPTPPSGISTGNGAAIHLGRGSVPSASFTFAC